MRLILVSDHRDWKASLDPRRVDRGLRVAMDFLMHSELATCKAVSQLRLKYDPETENYRVTFVQYDDGEHITLG